MSNRTPEPLTVVRALRRIRDRLRDAGIAEPDLEAELLLRSAFRHEGPGLVSRAWLYQRPGETVDESTERQVDSLLTRRLAGEPSAYITGVREFRSLDFEVTPDVLIPRPETELLVDKTIELAKAGFSPVPSRESERPGLRAPRIVDVGTGSGAIAVSLARELPSASIIATDLSWGALAVAQKNARRHGVEHRISFRHGDLLLPVHAYVDFIVANLPYVTSEDWRGLAPEVREHEPALALRGGEDGLDLIRSLLAQAPRYLRPGGAVCLEFGIGQAEALRQCAQSYLPGTEVEVFDDFAGIPRVLLARV